MAVNTPGTQQTMPQMLKKTTKFSFEKLTLPVMLTITLTLTQNPNPNRPTLTLILNPKH